MPQAQIEEDISDYVEAVLCLHEQLSNLPNQLKEETKSELLEKADGSYVLSETDLLFYAHT